MIRWATTAVGVALASDALAAGDRSSWIVGVLLVAYTAYRTARPLRYRGDVQSLLLVLGEVAATVFAIIATGYWLSPFTFSMLTAVAVAGFARGFGFGLRLGAASAAAVTLPWAADPVWGEDAVRLSVQWTVEILLVALVAGYARRISGEAEEQRSLAMDRLGRLSDANELLYSLHQVAQTLPASFDLDEALDSTIVQLRDLFEHDTAVVLLLDETDGRWHVARREGTRPPARSTTSELPRALRAALHNRAVVSETNLLADGGPGLSPKASSGLYAPLLARGSTIGLIAVEHGEPGRYAPRDAELMRGFAEPVALAIDNARWFARLRTVGADEERTRIARDLHDRIGQSLAYLAFELDRIVKHRRAESEDAAGLAALEQLRSDVRGVIGEVRDTLYDLRTDVSAEQSLPTTVESFLARVADRSGLRTTLRADEDGRLPILQERELWRIAQEAITNVERHARATTVTVTWRCDGTTAEMEVADDGIGFPVGNAGRLDSYGILGMRERAASIGARLEVSSRPGHGTRVRCRVDAP